MKKPTKHGDARARPEWGTGRVAFLAHAPQIMDMRTRGYSMTQIFNEMEGKLGGLSYEGFRYHVNRQRSTAASPSASGPLSPVPAATTTQQPPPGPTLDRQNSAATTAAPTAESPAASASGPRLRSFTFDPSPKDFS